MTKINFISNKMLKTVWIFSLVCLGGLGCSLGQSGEQPDCIEDTSQKPIIKKIERTRLNNITNVATKEDLKNKEWCHACVMGPHKFASCQRIFETHKGESKEAIRERAIDAACKDAGFEKDCPKSALKAIVCRGDKKPPSELTPGQSVQKMFMDLNPEVVAKKRQKNKDKELGKSTDAEKDSKVKDAAKSSDKKKTPKPIIE